MSVTEFQRSVHTPLHHLQASLWVTHILKKVDADLSHFKTEDRSRSENVFQYSKVPADISPCQIMWYLETASCTKERLWPTLTPNNCKRKCFSHYGIWAMRLVWHFLFKNNENVCDNLSLPFYFSWFKCGEKSFVLSVNNSSTIEQTAIWCLWHELKGSLTETFSCKTVFCMVLTKKYIYWSLSINFSPFTCFWKMTDHH